jgi:hypothetical protein
MSSAMYDASRTFRLQTVLDGVTAAEADEVRRLWLDAGVLQQSEAERRIAELLFLIRDAATDELVGVSTAYPAALPPGDARYWFLRMFVRKSHRGEAGLPLLVFRSAVTQLAGRRLHAFGPAPDCRGVAVVPQNPKLRTPRVLAWWFRQLPGWRVAGHDPAGLPIICFDFPAVESAGAESR